jgi:N utilization substance protein B
MELATMSPQQKRQSRELALQILFQTEFTTQLPYQDFLGLYEESVPKEILDYADQLIRTTTAQMVEIDRLIQSASQHWKLDRMAMVDRNVLRLAVCEMKYLVPAIKPSIVINEAVDIK